MIHIAHRLMRRFPEHSTRILVLLTGLSLGALALGVGVLLLG